MGVQNANITPWIDSAEQRSSIVNCGGCSVVTRITYVFKEEESSTADVRLQIATKILLKALD